MLRVGIVSSGFGNLILGTGDELVVLYILAPSLVPTSISHR